MAKAGDTFEEGFGMEFTKHVSRLKLLPLFHFLISLEFLHGFIEILVAQFSVFERVPC